MSVQRKRPLALIEFAKQSARLGGKPAATVSAPGQFALYEHEIQGLPGVRINVNGPETEDEIWFSIERLHEGRPPEVSSPFVRPWILMTQVLTEEPKLRGFTDGASLIAMGTHRSTESTSEPDLRVIAPETVSFQQACVTKGHNRLKSARLGSMWHNLWPELPGHRNL